jgi:hypothetical protein
MGAAGYSRLADDDPDLNLLGLVPTIPSRQDIIGDDCGAPDGAPLLLNYLAICPAWCEYGRTGMIPRGRCCHIYQTSRMNPERRGCCSITGVCVGHSALLIVHVVFGSRTAPQA